MNFNNMMKKLTVYNFSIKNILAEQ